MTAPLNQKQVILLLLPRTTDMRKKKNTNKQTNKLENLSKVNKSASQQTANPQPQILELKNKIKRDKR